MNALSGFLITSLFFVLATTVEFAIVLMIKRFDDFSSEKPPEGPLFHVEFKKKEKDVTRLLDILEKKFIPSRKKKSMTDKVDFVSLIFFMVSYFIFCFGYFVHYL